jgi:hypothetical protein
MTREFVLLAAGPAVALIAGLAVFLMARTPTRKRGDLPSEHPVAPAK